MTLGSLFDGSGGLPLAGAINGIKPVWASEIEPYPIRVTKARLHDMEHLGSVMDVKGDKITPVDIITFGSPCQDLSVAGKQKGIHEGERSSLFFEAIRIAKEMREHDRATGRADVDLRPRFLVWENVPGAFSSNGGEDFRAVLEAIGGIAEDGVSIPRPTKGKWEHAGCVVGDGWSIAWRLYDAQYWGVPQRRKRIYLVADLASERAGEILFERESLCGDPAEGGEAWQGIAGDAQGGAGGSGFFEPASLKEENWRETPISGALRAEASKSSHAVVAALMGGQGEKAGGIGYSESISPTIKSVMSGSNTVPDVCIKKVYDITGTSSNSMKSPTPDSCFRERTVSRTLDTFVGTPECNQGGMVVVNAIDCRNYRAISNLSGTLQAKPNGGQSLNYQNPVVYSSSSHGSLSEGVGTLGTGSRATAEMVAVFPPVTGALCANSHPGSYTGQDAFNDMLPVVSVDKPHRRYIVRRLTPLECCRLQGFPDWWEDGVEGSDSARYKMWGNGIALPCAVDVLKRISEKS